MLSECGISSAERPIALKGISFIHSFIFLRDFRAIIDSRYSIKLDIPPIPAKLRN